MPWETKIFDITHNYYNRIFEDVRNNDKLTAAFETILFEDQMSESALSILTDAGFMDDDLQVLYIDTTLSQSTLRLYTAHANVSATTTSAQERKARL